MKILSKSILAFIFFCSITSAQVESPPDLSLGAQGLLFEKGSIDVALLSELITEKQNELKKELIKRNVINALHQNNYTSYAFTYSALTDIMTVTDKKSMSKKLLIYIEDFALVYGFTEFYLQASGKLGNSQLSQLLKQVMVTKESDSLKPKKRYTADTFFPKGKDSNALYLSDFSKYNLVDDANVTLSDFLIDYFYTVLKSNPSVHERGFLKLENYGTISYLYTTYNKFLNSNYVKDASSLTKKVTSEIDLLFRYYSLIKDMKNVNIPFSEIIPSVANHFDYTRSTNDSLVILRKSLDSAYVKKTFAAPFAELKSNKEDFYKDLQVINTANQNYSEPTQKKLREYVLSAPSLVSAAEELVSRYQTIAFQYTDTGIAINLKNSSGTSSEKIKNLPFYASDLYYINKVAKPALAYMTQFANLDAKYINNLEAVENAIQIIMVYNAIANINELAVLDGKSKETEKKESILGKVAISNFTSFVGLVASLDEFNLAETYVNGLDILSSASELLQSYKAGQYIKIVVELLQTYTNVDTANNQIDINVEQIIVELYNTFVTNNTQRPVNFFFSIGISSTVTSEGSEKLIDSGGNETSNLVFAAEKIGVKVNLLNIEKRRLNSFAQSIDQKTEPNLANQVKPIFTDIYWSAYTSGLLYNIVNTSNAENKIGGYMIGSSLGTSFFNNMDLNVFINFFATKTQDLQLKNSLIGISWDIPIIEYISALTKKRPSPTTSQTSGN